MAAHERRCFARVCDEPHPGMRLNGVGDRGISSALRLIPNRNKKNTQIRLPLGDLGSIASWRRDLQSGWSDARCDSRHCQGLNHEMGR
jgi:hypothetical protein